jgi:hypothetical protein
MYPRYYFELFPPFPREDRVFVAMDFGAQFDARFEHVIRPGICKVSINGARLEPHRIDNSRTISDSIMTDILSGISNDRIIFADLTSLGWFNGKPVRNGNVMYEIGLAQQARLPEEVILFRSDQDILPFDLANVRINLYDPDRSPDTARERIAEVITDALKEIDLKRHLAVKAAAQTLDAPSVLILVQACAYNGIQHFPTRNMRQTLGNAAYNTAIARLLEIGALTTDYLTLTQELVRTDRDDLFEQAMKYNVTPFGEVTCEYVVTKMMTPDIWKAVDEAMPSEEISSQ